MAGQAARWPANYGLTGPLSEDLPTQEELKLTDELIAELKKNNNFEAPEDTEKRRVVLATMQKIMDEFVKTVGRKKGLSQSAISEAHGRVFTFGSYRLGVFGPGSDIDTLLVGPRHVSREDFFQVFPGLLEEMSPKGAIEEIKCVPDAYVPIIKLHYSGIDIDLIYGRLNLSVLPKKLDLTDNEVLRGLDETDQRCLNGTRVTDEMLNLVPETKTFRLALRTVKLWAQRRAVYANIMGFPGGVAWALMVARICQMYPKATAAKVLVKFFTLVARWPWPRPIILKQITDGPFPARVWNPVQSRSDRNHLMPIITPAFPCMCATHNISLSSKAVITKELDRAREIAEKISNRQPDYGWSRLFERHTFFSKDFKYYLSIVSASKTKEAQLIWGGLVESKVRHLVSSMELSQQGIEIARPFVKGFEREHQCRTEAEVEQVLQGSLAHQVSATETTTEQNDASHAAAAAGGAENMTVPSPDDKKPNDGSSEGAGRIYTTTYYIGITLKSGNRSLDISYSTNDFTNKCTDWQQYNPDVNSLRVIYTRNYDLPEDVFGEGEDRPTKAKKVKATKADNTALKKRGYEEANLQPTNVDSQKRRRSDDANMRNAANAIPS